MDFDKIVFLQRLSASVPRNDGILSFQIRMKKEVIMPEYCNANVANVVVGDRTSERMEETVLLPQPIPPVRPIMIMKFNENKRDSPQQETAVTDFLRRVGRGITKKIEAIPST